MILEYRQSTPFCGTNVRIVPQTATGLHRRTTVPILSSFLTDYCGEFTIPSMTTTRTIRTTNKGLTVRLNFWSLEKYLDGLNTMDAGLAIRGQALNGNTGQKKMFNHPGELLTILSKWNVQQFKKLKAEAKRQ